MAYVDNPLHKTKTVEKMNFLQKPQVIWNFLDLVALQNTTKLCATENTFDLVVHKKGATSAW